jgi:hypothetical protein
MLDGRTYDEKPERILRPVPDDGRRKAMLADMLAVTGT